MIQFNLLPAVKLEYVKAQRTKRLLTLVSIVVSAAALAILAISFVSVDVVQKKSLRDLNSDINKYSTQLTGTKDLNKMLTVQNQLNTLKGLHTDKPVATRLYTYLSQVTPAQATLNHLTADFSANTMSISGQAPSLDVVSTYTDTLKATQYLVKGSTTKTPAFTQVVLTTFGRDNTGASFTITFNFNPAIFQSQNDITLVVPSDFVAGQSSIFGTGK